MKADKKKLKEDKVRMGMVYNKILEDRKTFEKEKKDFNEYKGKLETDIDIHLEEYDK